MRRTGRGSRAGRRGRPPQPARCRTEHQARADDHLGLARPPRVGQAVGHPGGGQDREQAVAQSVERLVRHGQHRGLDHGHQAQPDRHDRPAGDQERLAPPTVGQPTRRPDDEHPGHHAHDEGICEHPLRGVQVSLEEKPEIDAPGCVRRVEQDHRRDEGPEPSVLRKPAGCGFPLRLCEPYRTIAVDEARACPRLRFVDQQRGHDGKALHDRKRQQDRTDAVLLRHPAPQRGPSARCRSASRSAELRAPRRHLPWEPAPRPRPRRGSRRRRGRCRSRRTR